MDNRMPRSRTPLGEETKNINSLRIWKSWKHKAKTGIRPQGTA